MIDNFELIKPLLNFESDDDFYFVQIIQRKKDNPNTKGCNNNNRLIKAYYIKSVNHLDKVKDEIIHFCDYFNARGGINLNKISFYKTSFNTLKKISDQMSNRNFSDTYRAWNSCCGLRDSCSDRLWLLDFDGEECKYLEHDVYKLIKDSPPEGDKVVAQIPTKNGIHLITKPFDNREFTAHYPEIDIHKNNPTNLYTP